jgi:putative ABC transport system permease protein
MSWFSRLTNVLDPRRLDRDLADEIHDHLERRVADLVRDGMTPSDARRHARRSFGNVAGIREESRSIKSAAVLEATMQDVRYAWRGLLRRPAFALTAVVSISLAAGATTAVFSLVDATMLRPLPVPQPDRLVALSTAGPAAEAGAPAGDRDLFSYPLYDALKDAATPTARVALFDDPHAAEVRMERGAGSSEAVVSQFVSPDAFDILGVVPAAGRLFSPADDHVPSPRSGIVLSHDYWVRRFGGAPSVIGQSLFLDGRAQTVLGVTRAGFRGVEPGTFIDLWRPITTFDPDVFTNAAFRSFRLIARLGPGVTRPQLAARLQPTFHRHQEERIATGTTGLPPAEQALLRTMTLAVLDGRSGVSGFRQAFARPLGILLSLAVGILLVACSNVAGLVLARSRTRAGEVGLRIALGAGRRRLFRQFVTEGALVAAAGVAGGWTIARGLAEFLVARVSTAGNPVRLDLTFDARIVLVTVALCALAALLIGGLPAWRMLATRTPTLRGASRQITRSSMGRAFVAVQITFAFTLLVTGAAFVVSLRNLAAVNLGFDPANVAVFTMANDLGPSQRPLQLQLAHDLRARVAARPTVDAAATAWWAMFTGARRMQRVAVAGGRLSEHQELFYRVSPHYLETLHVPLLDGRDLDDRDTDDEPVASVVNLAFARKYFDSDSPIGRTFTRDDGVRHAIVGIAGDARYDGLRGGPEPIVYMPMKPPGVFTLYVRSSSPPASVAATVAREAGALGFGMRVRSVTTLRSLVASSIVTERLLASVGAACALMGLVLAVVGLFGLLNYAVAERTAEFGIRRALGASRRGIHGLVFNEAVGPVVLGLSAGLIASLLVIHAMRAVLFDVGTVDPRVVGAALVVFLGAAVVAGAIPARRAARVDPAIALRQN